MGLTSVVGMAISILNLIVNIGLLVVAGIGGKTALSALKASQEASQAAREANEQMKRDSIEQTRPYVYAEIIPSLAGPSSYDIRIVNAGKSSAFNLTLDYSEWPEELDDIGEAVRDLFRTPRTLPPSCSIRSFWRLEGDFTDGTKEVGMGCKGIITVQYVGDSEVRRQYSDSYQVMIHSSGAWPSPEEGPDPSHKLTCQQKIFYRLGQTLVRRVGELSR